MDILEKNMITSTTNTVLNYGLLEKNIYTILGQITSELPFTLTIIADNKIIPFGFDIIQTTPYSISFNSMEGENVKSIDTCESFILQFDTSTQKDINLKLWKPYPISPYT
jgi:hypothetical protein